MIITNGQQQTRPLAGFSFACLLVMPSIYDEDVCHIRFGTDVLSEKDMSTMTRNEKRILRELLRQSVRHDRWAWMELKRQINDLGYQSYYDAQGYFLNDIDQRVRRLPVEAKTELVEEWNTSRATDPITEQSFTAAYTLLALEEVIERARIACSRTWNWE